MEDLRSKRENEKIQNKFRKQNIIQFFKLNRWKILFSLIGLSILIFPNIIGTYIGTFITDFLGSIINNINL